MASFLDIRKKYTEKNKTETKTDIQTGGGATGNATTGKGGAAQQRGFYMPDPTKPISPTAPASNQGGFALPTTAGQRFVADVTSAMANTVQEPEAPKVDPKTGYEQAQKEYDAYVNSDEYKAKRNQNSAAYANYLQQGTGISTFPVAAAQQQYKIEEDETEKQLRAKRDYYKAEMDKAEDQKTYEAGVQEIEAMSPEDKRLLGEYVANRTQWQTNWLTGNQQMPTYDNNPLIQKYGYDAVRRMAETYERMQNQKNAQMVAEETAKSMEGRWGIADNIASVGVNLVSGLTSIAGRAMEAQNRTGQYRSLQGNTSADIPSIYAGTVRQVTADKISGGEEGGIIRKGLSIGYQGVMSAADSMTRAIVAGPAAPALAATGAFSQAVGEASKQGATPTQAVIYGIGIASIEAATEKIPLDEMMKAAKGGMSAAKAMARQALTEATEEEISFFAGLLWEVAVLQGKASYQQKIGEAVANGMSYAEAKAQADKEIWMEALRTAMVSSIAGGISGAATSTYGNATAAQEGAQSQQEPETKTETQTKGKQETPVQTTEQPVAAQDGVVQAQAPTVQTGTQTAAAPQGQPAAAAPVQTPDIQNAVQGVVQGLNQRQQAEAEARAEQERTREAILQGMAQEYGPMMPQAEPKSQLQQDVDNATAAALEQQGITQPSSVADVNAETETEAQTKTENESGNDTGVGIKGIGQAPQTEAELQTEQAKTTQQQEAQPVAKRNANEVKRSKVFGNTYQNATGKGILDIGITAEATDPNIGNYEVITEKQSFQDAVARTGTNEAVNSEYDYLLGKSGWSSSDNDTSFLVMNQLQKAGDHKRMTELARKQKTEATTAGQLSQSFAKYSRENTTHAAADAILDIDLYHEADVPNSFYRKTGFEEWKANVKESILSIANEIESVKDGDTEGMIDIISELAQFRKTTAWAGYSSDLTRRTARGLAKMDFDTLKAIAKTQLSMIPSDFRKRSAGEIIKAIRTQNMLFTITTTIKNATGNTSNGIMDAVSDSFGGRMVDALLSKVTGQRTVANDIKYAADYIKAAIDAADVAAAFVSLDIPMETQTKYSTGKARTFTPSANTLLGRMLSAYEKHMRYALEVSDKFFEGGTSYAVSKSLQDLGKKSGLKPKQIESIAQKTGERRTFKDPGAKVVNKQTGKVSENGRAWARTNVGVKKALNNIGFDGFGLGDLVQPFAAVSGEAKQVALDYSGGGMVSGLSEIISIIKDSKKGVPIDPYRQRSAATDFARGMSGTVLIAAFTALSAAGAIREDDRKLKWNLDSSLRWWRTILGGGNIEYANKAAAWEDADETITLDFLDPFNAQIHIGYLISQGESVPEALLKGGFRALLDMPVMDTFSEMADLQQTFTEISEGNMDGVYDAAGQIIGYAAGSVVPNWVRQTAQVIDPYYRDTYDINPIKKAGKQLVAGIPFASRMLPKKYDNLGQEQRRYEEGDEISAAIDALVTPWDTDNYKTHPVYTEIERLNKALKNSDINVTPPQPKRKINYTDNNGETHKDYRLTEEQYQKIAVTQGQTAYRIVENLVNSDEYKGLTDDQKAYALQAAYEYAQEKGKQAAIPNYYSEASAWISETEETDTKAFIARGARLALDNAIGNAVNSIKNSWNVTPAAKSSMEGAYDGYNNLSPEAQDRVLEDADTSVVNYIDTRNAGGTTQNYLDAVGNVQKLGDGAHQVEKWGAVAATKGLKPDVADALMKAYMTDYDPDRESPDKTEPKYDYMRHKMGMTTQEYVEAMRVYYEVQNIPTADLEKGVKKKDVYLERWQDTGLTEAEANELYYLLVSSNSKQTIDVIDWYNNWSGAGNTGSTETKNDTSGSNVPWYLRYR